MAPLGTVLSLVLLGLASSAAQRQVWPPRSRFSAPRVSSGFSAPRTTAATTTGTFRGHSAPTAFRVSTPSFQSGSQHFRNSAPAFQSNVRTFQASAPAFQSNTQTFRSSAPSSFKSSAPSTFRSSAPSSFRSSAPSSFRSSAPSSFRSSAPSSRSSAPSSFSSAPSSFKSSAPSSFSSSAPSSFKSSAPSSFKSSAPSSFKSSAPSSFKSSAPSSFKSSAPSSASSQGPKPVGRQRLLPSVTGGRRQTGAPHQEATRQAVRSAIQASTKYYVSWASGSQKTYTWDEADHECRKYGLRLISLTSYEKEAEISKLMHDATFPVSYYWTSATRHGHSTDFLWGNRENTPVCKPHSNPKTCHENWGRKGLKLTGQPDNAEGQENCLAVMNRVFPGDGITWHDTVCHHKKHFICERF